MRVHELVLLWLLVSGCATTRVVHLDTGQGAPLVHRPVQSAPVRLDAVDFEHAVTQLVLGLELTVTRPEPAPERRSLLASAGGITTCPMPPEAPGLRFSRRISSRRE